MDNTTKQQISGIVCLLCATCIVFCIAAMIPYGLSGDVDKVKFYFVFIVLAFLISLPFGVAYYYYRGQEEAAQDRTRQKPISSKPKSRQK
ncbi:MAG: hypothetical protein WBP26_00660 [Candidatus Saccharimonadales bacterium]